MPGDYLITFRTHGTWLHGDARGSMDPSHNTPGTPTIPHDPALLARDRAGLDDRPFTLDQRARSIVEASIRAVCAHRGWRLMAVGVRTNHLHVVVAARDKPEAVMNALKAWATRRLRESGAVGPTTKVWSRHGSTRWLTTGDSLVAACDYVTRLQESEAVRHRIEKRRGASARSDEEGGRSGVGEDAP